MTARDINKEELIAKYVELKSSYKVASFFNVTASSVKRTLKDYRVLRTQSHASKEKSLNHLRYTRTEDHRKKMSEFAKTRTGNKNSFYGKTHSNEIKKFLSNLASKRTGELNSNWKNGISFSKKRERELKKLGFRKVANACKNRDKHSCTNCGSKKHLHAHHILPYWLLEKAFYDLNNLTTLCTECHKNVGHLGDFRNFNPNLASESLLNQYNICRERLNELAIYTKDRCNSLNSTNN